MECDDATARGELTDSEWREIQVIVQTSFVILARSLGDQEVLGRLLAAEIEKNPLFPRLPVTQRLRLWQYCKSLLDVAYRRTDDSDS